jgi:WD40 repeat protein
VASEPAALALLQFCADRLWEARDRTWRRLTWDAYRALGGVEGALAAHADNVLASLSPAQQRACRSLFLRLVTADRTRALLGKRELLESAAAPDDAAAVLDRLVDARLLTTGEADEGSDARVELVHEALIRHWGALSGWLNEDVEGQRLSHALRQAAKEWETRKRPRGLLWRGDALLDLRRWRKRASDRLTATEAAFVEASEADERRGARVRRGLGAGAFLATSAFAAFMFFEWRAAEDARVETERQRTRAEVRGLVSEARNQEPAGKHGEALALLRAASALEDGEGQSAPTLVSLDMERLARAGAASRVLSGHAWGLMAAALSPDGKQVATASRDGTARVWDIATATSLRTIPGDDPLLSIAYSPDGTLLATTKGTAKADGGFAELWDAATGAKRRTFKLDSTANHVAFSRDGKLVVICSDKQGASLFQVESGELAARLGEATGSAEEAAFSSDGSLVLIRAGNEARVHRSPSGELVATLAGHERPILEAAFSRAGTRVATASADGTMRVWDARSGKETAKLAPSSPGYGKALTFHAVAWAPGDGQLAVGAKDGSVRLVDPSTGALLHTLHHHSAQVEAVAYSPSGRRLLSASLDGTALVWDPETGALVEALRGHKEGVLGGLFLGEEQVLTLSEDRSARLWNIVDGAFVRSLAGHTRSVDRIVASADGSILLSASIDTTARVWDTKTGACLAELTGHEGPVLAAAISPDGSAVVTGSMNTPARIWDARTGALRVTLPLHDKGANAAAFSADGKLVAIAAIDGPVSVWDAATGAEKRKLAGHDKKVSSVAFSSDGEKLATASWDGSARLWDLAGTAPARELRGAEGHVLTAVFSPDDKALAIAADQEVLVFDTTTGARRCALRGHEQQINAVVFSADGKLLATASLDGTLRTWLAASGALQKTFTGHTEAALDVAFSADGERLVSAGDSTVRVWHVATGALLDTLVPHRTDASLRGATAILPLGRSELFAAAAQDGSVTLFRIPRVDRRHALSATGTLDNHRVCRESLRVVPVAPQPAPESVWAPPAACKE